MKTILNFIVCAGIGFVVACSGSEEAEQLGTLNQSVDTVGGKTCNSSADCTSTKPNGPWTHCSSSQTGACMLTTGSGDIGACYCHRITYDGYSECAVRNATMCSGSGSGTGGCTATDWSTWVGCR